MRKNTPYTKRAIEGSTKIYEIPDLLNCFEEHNKDRLIECNKNDFYKNFAELMVSQFFSSFFDIFCY